jgi:hypothetical protein
MFGLTLSRTGKKISKDYIEDLRKYTPVKTGELKKSWNLASWSVSNGRGEFYIETDPVDKGQHYATRAEAYYRTHTSNSRGGNSMSYRFRTLRQAAWRPKVDAIWQKAVEDRFRPIC